MSIGDAAFQAMPLHDPQIRRSAERTLDWLRHHDPLTRLPNRALFAQRAEDLVSRCAATGELAVVLALDLDRFQLINESYGFEGGSELLRRVAERLAEAGASGEVVARSCADEFLVLASATCLAQVEAILVRYVSSLSRPFQIGEDRLHVDATFGVAFYPRHAVVAESLTHAAVTALHKAREAQAKVRYFEPVMRTEAAALLSMVRDLRFAIERDELTVAYQPQVDLASGRVLGVEALVRWDHPVHGRIPPSVFVPLAERNGGIERLTDRVLWRACHELATLRERHRALRLAVNLSAREMVDDPLAARVRRCLAASSFDPSMLDLEITEGTLMHDVDASLEALRALRELGVQLSVDDFGTGYSSLSYLRRFDLDILKIDRSFVTSIDAEDGDGGAIAELILGLAKVLGARVIAEGVETEAQAEILRGLGCSEAQGYLYSPPVSLDELETLV